MTDKEIWLILYHAILSNYSGYPHSAAALADNALVEMKKRWDYAPGPDVEE